MTASIAWSWRRASPSAATELGVQRGTAARLPAWSEVVPVAGTGTVLLALLVTSLNPGAVDWVPLLAVAGVGCFAVAAVRSSRTLHDARSALQVLEETLVDPLTGLMNRRGLYDRLDRWLAAGQPVTFLALDLAEFRRINEEAGHEIGDRVLQRVAGLLSAVGGDGTVAARIDGDDFALAFCGIDPARASLLAVAVRDVVGRRFTIDGHRLHLTINVGTATTHLLDDDRVSSAGSLLRCADQALAAAQSASTGTAVHDPGTCVLGDADQPLAWVADLHAALDTDDQLLLHVQPQYRIEPGGTATRAVGCEALLRWNHPSRGLLGPAQALRAAEHGHLGTALFERVLDLALGAVSRWWSRHPVPVAVNLSAHDLDDELLAQRIVAALARHRLPAAALAVEVVEDTLMLDPDRALDNLTALRSVGLRIAIDDYGTGYSSLAYLHRLPVDEVKFDRSLTAGISRDAAAGTIVQHSIDLAHALGLTALAEGVEDPADLELLATMGCDTVQGYLTGRPVPAAEWAAQLDHQTPVGDGSTTARVGEPDTRPRCEPAARTCHCTSTTGATMGTWAEGNV